MILATSLILLQSLSGSIVSSQSTVSAQSTGSPSKARSVGSRPVLPVSGFELDEVENGFGRLLPHTIFELGPDGQPTPNVVEIRSVDTYLANASFNNEVIPVTVWPAGTSLPNGTQGNHYITARFTGPIDVDTVLDPLVAASPNNQLLGTVVCIASDPVTGARFPVQGRAFIGGKTYGEPDPNNPVERVLETWIGLTPGGDPEALDVNGSTPGLGFPGTESSFVTAGALVDDSVFVFVADSDDDLTTYETFPSGVNVTLRITPGVAGTTGRVLSEGAVAASDVSGADLGPEVSIAGGPTTPVIIPGNGDTLVDPSTSILIEFTEPVRPSSVGRLAGEPPSLSAAVSLSFAPSFPLGLFSVRPAGRYDFTRMILEPGQPFPGSDPVSGCLDDEVTVDVNTNAVQDLSGNMGNLGATTSFFVGEGQGWVNAPVVPEAIYVARSGASMGMSIVDLNGFGAGTGNPTFDPFNPLTEGNSRFPLNPNVALQGALMCPPLSVGTCTFNGGSAGVFTLTKDTQLNDLVIGSTTVDSVGEMALGHSLDIVFNASLPFGCQSGGGNLCAIVGLKQLAINPGGAVTCSPFGDTPSLLWNSEPNSVAFAPHPNPPPLTFPPLCVSPLIEGQEPTSIVTGLPISAGGKGLQNLLVPGDPQGDPNTLPQIPPTGLLAREQNAWFTGPSLPQQTIANCVPFSTRQQIGQFLYVADRSAGEIVIFNSNRCRVLDRIPIPDPVGIAMSPFLSFLAITSQSENKVYFLDTDPGSSTFHSIVQEIGVGLAPGAIAWEPAGEDILVCNTGDNSISVISGFTLEVRKTLSGAIGDSGATLASPIDIAITQRQDTFGLGRGVYFAFILDSAGQLVLYESGPNNVNGWGFDELIGKAPFPLIGAKSLQPDQNDLRGAVWIAHEEALSPDGVPSGLDEGAISKIRLEAPAYGFQPLQPGDTPNLRGLEFIVDVSIGGDILTGKPVDLVFDEMTNVTGLLPSLSFFSSGSTSTFNSKCQARRFLGPEANYVVGVNAPAHLFVAIPESSQGGGVIDVIDLLGPTAFTRRDTNVFQPGVQSIPADGVTGLSTYLRQ